MKKPRTLKECRTGGEVREYVLEHDGLPDADLEAAEFIRVGPTEDVAEIISVSLDSETVARLRKIAKKTGRTPNALIREWTAQRSRRELATKKQTTAPTKRVAG